jgi:hypothetical protein
MRLTVDLGSEPAGVTLEEPADCARFAVVVGGSGDAPALERALVSASVGRMEQDEALVAVAAVRRLASGSVGVGWEEDFTAMLEYAGGRGWLTEDGVAIRAHVEWH